MLTFNLNEIPFSPAGSFLIIDARNGKRLAYRTSSSRAVSRRNVDFWANDFFELALVKNGTEVPYTWTAQPHRLDLSAEGGGSAVIAFANPETLLVQLQGVALRLVPLKSFGSLFRPHADTLALIDWPARGFHYIKWAAGAACDITPVELPGSRPWALHGDRPYQVTITGPGCALRFTPYETRWEEPLPEMNTVLAERQQEYSAWQAKMPRVPDRYHQATELAWFLMWGCQVPKAGALTRPVIYMSKFWMNQIWAWDNCFNALSVARADPDLAFQQLLLFFDHQDPHGMIPDSINDLEALYNYNKPPIHGWTIHQLIQKTGVERARPYLAELYEPLGRLTDWWFNLRDYDHDGMCQYHHGNDSGWDNATAFDQGYPTEGADLAAHLVLQCEGLAEMATLLGRPADASRWKQKAAAQLDNLLQQGVKVQHFFSPLSGQKDAPACQSLLNYIPMELGSRLPESLRQTLVSDLQPGGPFLTEWGLATESPASPKYEADGYWRGPIWAPSTYLIFDGLADAGETSLARTVAERFCELCLHDPGFWENYDALTGNGLRCPAYSWTAAVFILLAEWLAEHPA